MMPVSPEVLNTPLPRAAAGQRIAAPGILSEPLRIILVLLEPPLPFGNAAARWYYVLLRGLVQRGHSVTALAACSQAQEIAQARQLFPSDSFDLRCFAFPQRSSATAKIETILQPHSYMFSAAMRADLARTLQAGYDILHLEQLWTGWLGGKDRDRALLNVHYSFAIDLKQSPPSSRREWLQRLRARQAERRLLRQYSVISALTPRLADWVRRQNPHAEVHVVPLGIDLSLYPFQPRREQAGVPVLGLIGSFNWEPSRSAGERLITRLWPAIRRQIPDARLQIVGRRARHAFARFLDLPGICIEEDVPDTLPWFRGLDLLVYAPECGSGMKVKIMEAFALGTAVVTNTDGIEGIAAEDGIHAGISDQDEGLVARVVALLKDAELRERQRCQARALIERVCSPAVTVAAVESVYGRMLERLAGTPGWNGRRERNENRDQCAPAGRTHSPGLEPLHHQSGDGTLRSGR